MTNTIDKVIHNGDEYEFPSSGWDVVWPASATDGHLVLFDWATWKLIKDWWAVPTWVPSWWTDWQVLSKVSWNIAWANAPVTSVNSNTWAVTVSEFNATSWATKVFDMPAVWDDISDIITWLSWWGAVILYDSSSNYYYNVWNFMPSIWWFSASWVNTWDKSSIWYYINYDLSTKLVTIKTQRTAWLAPDGWSNWQVLTWTSNGRAWASPDVLISDQANNILTSWMKIWAGEESDYANLWTYDPNCLYLTVPDSN